MKKIFFLFPLCALMACSSNSESSDDATTETQDSVTTNVLTDIQLEITQQGIGELPKHGDIVSVHYTGTLLATGEKFDSSFDYGKPFKFPLGQGRVIPGWDKGIAQLNKGCKARLTVPAHLAYADREIPGIPAHSDLVFELEVMDIEAPPRPWAVEGLEVKETMSGLRYVVLHEGKGEKLAPGRNVLAHYSGYLASNGMRFDSSLDRGEPIEFPLGAGKVIPGWDEGFSQLNVGTKAQLFIPANLGYGDKGAGGVIPPGADLIFDVEVVGVK